MTPTEKMEIKIKVVRENLMTITNKWGNRLTTKPWIYKNSNYPLCEISNKERRQDLSFALSRGNHKSTITNKPIMKDLLQEDIIRGFSLAPPIRTVPHLENVSISPLGCQQQDTIDKNDEITQNNHLT